ncbi:MAG: LPXTG cell wall anchor domain-containing protein [Enterococcus faecium]|uniref:LPXTG cell wall anchor domain-containing protein n=1 Tax=Enterococcus mundtii TaxID=53346 RepID=A0A2T5DFG1_ENTMU|nr:LPXTG cell wall anchor domain-containing protein [Enterococcus mundtii]MBE6171264.1 LPXTG cell wall anchor domain-containing protein [Enterococcus faecium]PTO36916.1 hypothetical protein C6N14_02175 [Enterococcus mundtii]
MSTTTIDLNGRLGIETPALTPSPDESPTTEINQVARTEVKVVQPMPQTNDQTGIYLSLLGFVLIFMIVGVWFLRQQLDNT